MINSQRRVTLVQVTPMSLSARTFSGIVSHHALAESLRLDSKAAMIRLCAEKTLAQQGVSSLPLHAQIIACDVVQQRDFFWILDRPRYMEALTLPRQLDHCPHGRFPVSRQSALETWNFSIPQGWALERNGRLQSSATFQLADGTDIIQPRNPPSASL